MQSTSWQKFLYTQKQNQSFLFAQLPRGSLSFLSVCNVQVIPVGVYCAHILWAVSTSRQRSKRRKGDGQVLLFAKYSIHTQPMKEDKYHEGGSSLLPSLLGSLSLILPFIPSDVLQRKCSNY